MSETSLPQPIQCIGIILDGNRRWAKERNLPTLEGHLAGFENIKSTARNVRDRGIPHLVVYAFSTENWKRSEEEVSYLMGMIRSAVLEGSDELIAENIRLRFVGDLSMLDSDIQKALSDAEKKSADKTALTLWVCLSYGGRAEIVRAAERASKEGEVTTETLSRYLWSAGMPDPDIIIRTGGQKRLSNFLLWQAAYSELFFLTCMWPDFGENDLDGVLSEYAVRKRNFGT